ncbi:hypothetical protein SynA15127_02025 [Synechococcus sp. A15-127]|nr:hypothetical protein SynA15127_02025 [Synechococcus sp. A15-127]
MSRGFAELHPFSIRLFLASKSEIFNFRHISLIINQAPVIELESLLSIHHITKQKNNENRQIRAIFLRAIK